MTSVTEHYENHLAPIYVWMAGGFDAAIARGQTEVNAVCPRPLSEQWAVDLGAGFGVHAIPLANLGYSVLAIDSSGTLLDVMRSQLGARAIKIVRDDLTSFKRHIEAPVALVVCMGDTLTHLPDRQSIEKLFADVAESLDVGGTFVLTFRDYTTPLSGLRRFINVRSESDRILTCFLEYEEDAVTVYDILHERRESQWTQSISSYRKLRISPDWVVWALEAVGFQVRSEQGLSGMARIIAKLAR